jgi:DNA-binding transcriptional LysR family regulator
MNRNLESLDLNLVNVLYWILSEESVSAAAERLGLSQPAVSRALGRLRDVYDDPLLVKQGRKMVPTPLATELFPLVSHAVESLRHVANATGKFDPSTHVGTYRIGIKDGMGIRMMEIWERNVAQLAPGLSLDFVQLEATIAPDVVSGKVDLVVMPLGESIEMPENVDITQFVVRPACQDEYVTCLRKGHPLAGKPLALDDYVKLDHILINPMRGERSSVDDYLEAQGLSRRIAYRSQSFLLAKEIMKRTDCVLTMCESLIGRADKDVWVCAPPVPMPAVNICAGWHPNWTQNPRHKWVRERLMSGLCEPLRLAA